MTILEIGGQRVEVGDEFLKLSPDEQETTVKNIAEQLGSGGADHSLSVNNIVRSAAEGVPIIGGLLNKANAATNALIAPAINPILSDKNKLQGNSWYERYKNSLAQQEGMSKGFEEAHPVVDTAAKLAGGAGAFAPLASSAAAARALGLTGSLPGMVARGAASNAAISAADAAIRGENPATAAEVGGVTGAAFPLAGRAVGAIARQLRPGVRPNPTVDVAGSPIPQFGSSAGDQQAGNAEQRALSGVLGPGAQGEAQQAFAQRGAALDQAGENIAQAMRPAPAGSPPQPTPDLHAAGGQTITDLAQQHNDQIQREAAAAASAQASGTGLRQRMAPGAGTTVPPSAFEAMQATQDAIQRNAQAARNVRTAAYQQAGAVPGEFTPSVFERISQSLRNRLNAGPPQNRVRVNDNTPRAAEALQLIEEEIGSGRRPTNAAEGAPLTMGPDGRPVARPITGEDVEAVRQQLVPLMRDANRAARGPGGSAADARAMRAIMDAFDAHVRDAVRAGGFTGDGQELLRRYDVARQLHANYRQNYSNRGQGDIVGPAIESIIGKHPGQEMTPEAMASALYGPAASPGGNKQVALMQRLQQILSPEDLGTVKQGLLSHMLDTPAGAEALDPREQVKRLRGLSGQNSLGQTLFTPEERAAMQAHANRLEATIPHDGPLTDIDRKMLRLAGADGFEPPTTRQAVDMLFPGDGTKPNPQLLMRVRDAVTPDTWNQIRQAAWKNLIEKPGNGIEWGPQKVHERIEKFLANDHAADSAAAILFSPQERQMMRLFSAEQRKAIPLPHTVNYSNSGTVLSNVANAARHNLMRMLGLATHGPAGFATGYALDKALEFASNRRAVNRARDAFYGKPQRGAVDPRYEQAAALLSHIAPRLIGGQ